MIEKALVFVSDLLNKELKMNFGLTEDIVVVGSLINLDGSITNNIENKVVISVLNLEHEKVVKSTNTYIANSDGSYNKVNPPVHLNLYLLISANYNSENYMEALKMLSEVIGVFQATHVFTPKKNPDLDSSIERLTLEIFNVPIQELSHVWSGIGAKYVPSIVYKLRMISIQKGHVQENVKGISGLHTSAKKA